MILCNDYILKDYYGLRHAWISLRTWTRFRMEGKVYSSASNNASFRSFACKQIGSSQLKKRRKWHNRKNFLSSIFNHRQTPSPHSHVVHRAVCKAIKQRILTHIQSSGKGRCHVVLISKFYKKRDWSSERGLKGEDEIGMKETHCQPSLSCRCFDCHCSRCRSFSYQLN